MSSDECKSTLVSKNVTILNRRTSVRLEPEMWTGLNEIADREGCSIHDVCSLSSMRKNENTSLTAAIRVFIMLYFRAATNEEGHKRAGHGSFRNMLKRARIGEDYAPFFKSAGRRQQQSYSQEHSGWNDQQMSA